MAIRAGYEGLKRDQIERLLKSLDQLAELLCDEDTAGSYYLTATVDNEGAVTYSWAAIE